VEVEGDESDEDILAAYTKTTTTTTLPMSSGDSDDEEVHGLQQQGQEAHRKWALHGTTLQEGLMNNNNGSSDMRRQIKKHLRRKPHSTEAEEQQRG
jgi:hypothetical protein